MATAEALAGGARFTGSRLAEPACLPTFRPRLGAVRRAAAAASIRTAVLAGLRARFGAAWGLLAASPAATCITGRGRPLALAGGLAARPGSARFV
jgi:hypothetical protein